MQRVSPFSMGGALLALICLTTLSPCPSSALPAGPHAIPRPALLVPIVDVCRTYMDGDTEVTLYCKDGLTCGEDDQGDTKCFADVDEMSGQDSDGEGGEGAAEWEYFNKPQASSEPEKKTTGPPSSPAGSDCESAGEYEQQTAGWYYACVLNKLPERRSSYKPKIDPADLRTRATQQCQGSSDFGDCVDKAKQEMILAADPGIRDACSGNAGMAFIRCVDRRYVYGPSLSAVREEVDRMFAEARLRAKLREGAPADRSKLDSGPKPQGCPRGYGMKPDREAFGAWTCQRLGTLSFGDPSNLPPGYARPTEEEESKKIDAFENSVDDVAQDAVESALQSDGQSLSQTEREQCAGEAYDAVRSIMKGGATDVSAACRELVGSSRGELAHYIRTHSTSGDPALEELLSALQPEEAPSTQESPDNSQSSPSEPEDSSASTEPDQSDTGSSGATEDCAWFCENAHSVVCDEENRIDLTLSGGDIQAGIDQYGCEVAP